MNVRLVPFIAVSALAGLALGVQPAASAPLPPLLINEVMASNSESVADPQGQYDDWIELRNTGQEAVDVGGMYLTDNPGNPTMWRIPTDRPLATTIPPDGYLLIWTDGDVADAGLHAGFKLDADGDQVALFDTDGTTLIDSVQFDAQIANVSYGRDADGQWQFLIIPSPGFQNIRIYAGLATGVRISHEAGFYDRPFSVTIATEIEGAAIYYTTDGSSPFDFTRSEPTGQLYTGPVPIATTTCLRAVAYKYGWKTLGVSTRTYIFLKDVIRQPARPPGWPTNWAHTGSGDYEMDPQVVDDPRYRDTILEDMQAVPTLSLVTDRNNWFGPGGQGIYLQGELVERPVSAELIFPNGREGFQIDCAVMIVGGSSPQRWKMDKLSMRLKFQAEYGPTRLKYSLFDDDATDEFDTLVVDARMNSSWPYGGGVPVYRDGRTLTQRDTAQYTRDQFAADIQNAMGGYGPRGRHVHLYLNGLYWGLYWLHERPDEHFAADYFGGADEDYDVLKHNPGDVINGSGANYNEMFGVAASGLTSGQQYERIQQYLDVPNFIDYMILNYYVGNSDWAHQNWYATRSRVDPAGRWRYHSWDAEHIMEAVYADSTGKNDSGGPTWLHHRLAANAEYRMSFADHVHRHLFNDGVVTPQGGAALYQVRLDEVGRAVVGESARWGDNRDSTPRTRDVDWVRERDWILNTYFPGRTQVVLNQFRSRGWYPNVDAPEFAVGGLTRHGGYIVPGQFLSMTATGGTIWYTLDGTDPRVPGITPQGGANLTLVPENARKHVLIPAGPVDDAWRTDPGFVDTAWIAGTGGVGYERSSGFESFIGIDVNNRMYKVNSTCYIRIPFSVTAADLAGLTGLTLKVRYDDGFIAYLNGVEVQRALFTGTPAWDSAAAGSHPDNDARVLESFALTDRIGLLHAGTNVLAIHALNQTADSSDFLLSLELVGEKAAIDAVPIGVAPTAARYVSPITLPASTHVKARVLSGSTWSALNEAVFAVGPVAQNLRISEIMYHPLDSGNPADPNVEYVELTNIGAERINLNLVQFTRGVQFTFPSVELSPGRYCLLVRDLAAFQGRYGLKLPVLEQYVGSLDNAGERIELCDAAGTVIHQFRYDDDWFDITDGLGFSLTVKDPRMADPNALDSKSAWRPSAYIGGSPGADDSGQVPPLGSVVINELLANSQGSGPDWIELHNTTGGTIHLGGWFLSDDADDLMKYEIAAGTSIAAGGYVVFTENLHFSNIADPGCHTPFALSAEGETVYLHSGSAGALTGYSEQEKFGASEPGVSLGRWEKSTGTYNFVALREPTPGAANAEPKVGPVVIHEIMYHPDAPADAEYVELLNISDGPVTLYDDEREAPWRFTDDPEDPAVELLLPADASVTLGAGEYLLLVKDVSVFRSRYTAPAGVQIQAWGPGRLANGSGRVQLSKPGDLDSDNERAWIRVDRVVYSDGSHNEDFPTGTDPWPKEASGGGKSLARIDATAYGNDPDNWRASPPSPGSPNP